MMYFGDKGKMVVNCMTSVNTWPWRHCQSSENLIIFQKKESLPDI